MTSTRYEMKNPFFLLALLLVMAASQVARAYTSAEIDRFRAVFTRFPRHVPTSGTTDAPVTGNGDIGLTMAAAGVQN